VAGKPDAEYACRLPPAVARGTDGRIRAPSTTEIVGGRRNAGTLDGTLLSRYDTPAMQTMLSMPLAHPSTLDR
jgi:hypothetical protein